MRSKFSPLLFFYSSMMLFLLSSCTTAYKSYNHKDQVERTQSVAILPFEIIHTGTLPKNMSCEEMKTQDDEERIAFQKTLYEWVGYRLRGRDVRMQNIQETLARLTENGIDVYNIEEYAPSDLSRILGVDAVVVPSATKRRYRSDNASFVMDLGQTVLAEVSKKPIPVVNSKTNDIQITVSLVESSTGDTIWRHGLWGSVNWAYPAHMLIDDLAQRLVRTMPRKKKNRY
jgi:hypothetical protein